MKEEKIQKIVLEVKDSNIKVSILKWFNQLFAVFHLPR
jgi:hypothetical protein